MIAPGVLISVYNISGYLMAGVQALGRRGVQVAIIEHPCRLSETSHKKYPSVLWLNRAEYASVADLLKALGDWRPDVYLCCGWDDRLCRKLALNMRGAGVTTVVGVDTPWEGRLRQYIHCLYSRFYLTKTFDVGWGAGTPQSRYLQYRKGDLA